MAVVVTNTWVRPNTGVDWYISSEAESDYFEANFHDNNKLTVNSTTISGDGLTRTRVVTFTDDATRNEWKADSTVATFHNNRKTYCTNNSISYTISVS